MSGRGDFGGLSAVTMIPALDAGDDCARLFLLAQEWLAAGHRLALATVIRTWGSAPRRAGAHLLIREDGLFQGSVSGGCVEGEVIVAGQSLIAAQRAQLFDYGINEDVAWRAGLACGGTMQILVQPIHQNFFSPQLVEDISAAQTQGAALWVTTDLHHFQSRLAPTKPQPSDDVFARSYQPPLRLAIIGAVHIAQHLAAMATHLGIRPRIIDPRGLFATEDRFAADLLDKRWPDEALADFKLDSASALVTLTHDPKLDDVALRAALQSPAFYIAALGSRQNHARRLQRLEAMGFDADARARVHGPAGLAIGAANPGEIAISILAQLVQQWRQRADG